MPPRDSELEHVETYKDEVNSDVQQDHSSPLSSERDLMKTKNGTENDGNQDQDHEDGGGDGDQDGFLERQARRVGSQPCLYLWVSLVVALAVSAIGLIVGEFSVTTEGGGFNSRGTLISEREAQRRLVDIYNDYLFRGGDAAWDDLINNVQEGPTDDDDEEDGDRRNLANMAMPRNAIQDEFDRRAARHGDNTNWVSLFVPRPPPEQLSPQAGSARLVVSTMPFRNHLDRLLQDAASGTSSTATAFEGCSIDIYTNANFTAQPRLWPVWEIREDQAPSGATATALDPQAIQDICVAEVETMRILEADGLCFGCDDGSCMPPYSIVLYARLLVPGGPTMTCAELRDAWGPYQQSTEQEWATCTADIKGRSTIDNSGLPDSCPSFFSTSLIDQHFAVDGDNTVSYTSSIFPTREDNVLDMYDIVDDFDRGTDFVRGAYDTQTQDFIEEFSQMVIQRDMLLAMGSAVTTTIAIAIHTKSLFVTLLGLLQIVLSFPIAYFVYKLVLGFEFFPFLNFIGVFVVFALGADDIFVATDKWKNTRLAHPKATTEQIAAHALPDAAEAMFLTTLTTSVAFFATAICPVATIRLFSIFVGLLILFDYLLNLLLVFPALAIYDRSIVRSDGRPNCCINFQCNCGGGDDEGEGQEDHNQTGNSIGDVINGSSSDPNNSLIRHIMLGYYALLHRFRWPLFAASAIGFGVSAYFASTISLPTDSDIRMIGEEYQFEQAFQWRRELLVNSLENSKGTIAHVIWGVTPADTGDHYNPASFTALELDDDFEPSDEAAQTFLSQFCNDFFAEDFASPIGDGYKCPIQSFEQWLQDQAASNSPDDIYTQHCAGADALPVPKESFDACIVAWGYQTNESGVLSRNGKVEIILFPFYSRVLARASYESIDEEWNLLEGWFDDYNENIAPPTADSAYFSSEEFAWYDTNGEIIKTAFSSGAIALSVSAVVILFSSRSFVLTLFSTLTIGYVLASVMAMVVGIGWNLGFLESVCIAILIGISCDFVIHFSHAYASLPGEADRGVRTKYALIKMGPSVLAAAFTTVSSAVIMIFTIFAFFQQFAIILFFTLIQSTVGSFVVFLSIMDCVGPTNPTLTVDTWLAKLVKGGDKKEVATDNAPNEGVAGGADFEA